MLILAGARECPGFLADCQTWFIGMQRFRGLLLCGMLLYGGGALGQKNYSLSITVAPTYAYTVYKPQFLFPDSDGQVVEPILLTGRSHSAGYLIGPAVEYTYAPGWSVASGVWFNTLTYRQARRSADGQVLTAIRNRSLRVPVLLNYRQSAGRLAPYWSGGLLLEYLLPARVLVRRDEQPRQRLDLTYNGGLAFRVSVAGGWSYRLTNRIRLLGQLMVNYNLGKFGQAATHNPSLELNGLMQTAWTF
ncbi:PorT family protein [Fibrisoma montanum]|uniref:PorT family protein n=2 Tax=Fibrisoma montanum TaxID=2305895 RepID=A0A418ME09_9BACT|nr:PorT family protein [Fibrisoma montanum]